MCKFWNIKKKKKEDFSVWCRKVKTHFLSPKSKNNNKSKGKKEKSKETKEKRREKKRKKKGAKWQLHKNTVSNIEQVLKVAPNKAPGLTFLIFFTLKYTQTSFSWFAGTFLLWEDIFVVGIHYKHFIHSCVLFLLQYIKHCFV